MGGYKEFVKKHGFGEGFGACVFVGAEATFSLVLEFEFLFFFFDAQFFAGGLFSQALPLE